MSGANEGATSYLPVKISKGVRYVHRVTGKPLKMVAEEVLYTVDDEEGDPVEMSATQLRPARWYKPENIVEESLGFVTRYVPLRVGGDMAAKKAAEKIGRPVLVTTEYRGVFFGYAEDTSGETIILKKARNCIYWAASVGGFLGLASTGPNKDCRIGAEVEQFEARRVTSVTEVSAEAAKKWGDAPCYKN